LVWFGLVWFGLVWFGLVWFALLGDADSTSSMYGPGPDSSQASSALIQQISSKHLKLPQVSLPLFLFTFSAKLYFFWHDAIFVCVTVRIHRYRVPILLLDPYPPKMYIFS
jgi:hypothetical protein